MLKSLFTLTALALFPVFASAGEGAVGRSYTPIIGYDDKNGLLYGAAVFVYREGRPGFNHGIYGVTNGNNVHSLNLDLEQRGQSLDLSAHGFLSHTFDNYYGEGHDTQVGDGWRISQDRGELDAAALWRLGPVWALGPSAGLKFRQENGVESLAWNPAPAPARAFADSSNAYAGLKLLHDSRDSDMNSTQGRLFALEARALPAAFAMLPGGQDAWQATADWREFIQLPFGLVWAQRASGGASAGTPGYAERYSLGGTARLRGFQDNRFRGLHFYCLQEELRIPVWKALSAAVSVDAGDVADGRLDKPRYSGQAGLRLGLPPSYGMKARLDFGFADGGERSMALQFGQTF